MESTATLCSAKCSTRRRNFVSARICGSVCAVSLIGRVSPKRSSVNCVGMPPSHSSSTRFSSFGPSMIRAVNEGSSRKASHSRRFAGIASRDDGVLSVLAGATVLLGAAAMLGNPCSVS